MIIVYSIHYGVLLLMSSKIFMSKIEIFLINIYMYRNIKLSMDQYGDSKDNVDRILYDTECYCNYSKIAAAHNTYFTY